MANVLERNFIVNEFEVEPYYYVYFRTNNPGEGMNPLITRPSWPSWQGL